MTTRVLVVDDEADIRTLLDITLSLAGYEVVTARDGVEGLELAQLAGADLIVADLMMPRMDGLTLLTELRTDPRTAQIPVIMLTAQAQQSGAANALHAGADDYVAKPFDSDELVARVGAIIRRSEQQRARNPLTGLPGNDMIHQELQRRVEDGEEVGLLYADIDHFKAYNDYYGFMRGDHTLQATARVITDICANTSDRTFVGHIGGDDFVVITNAERVEHLAEEICRQFDGIVPSLYDPDERARGYIDMPDRYGVDQRYQMLRISVGVTTSSQHAQPDADRLVHAATEMKQFAKSLEADGSRWARDRRGHPPGRPSRR
ncbi:MAG: response regulator [Nitriliruptoraceae bacterium]